MQVLWGLCGVMEKKRPAKGSEVMNEQESQAYEEDQKLYILNESGECVRSQN